MMLRTVTVIWESCVRYVLGAAVLLPIWLGYFWPWLLAQKLGIRRSSLYWSRKHRRYAKRFRWLSFQMRGGLIKVGQIISTRVDLMPTEWIEELAILQDRVDPTPWSVISKHLEAAFDPPLDALFTSIEETPIAAASFGQVHPAITTDGQRVALKIKYPDIDRKLAIDLTFFRAAVKLFNIFIPNVELSAIFTEVSRALSTELDYEQEARFTRIIHQNFKPRELARIPEVLEQFTRPNVICTTFLEGRKITSSEVLEHPNLNREALLRELIETWIQMMYVDGVFQSDPHPGNLLVKVDETGQSLAVVDFGQVKILPKAFHQKLVSSVMAFAMGNPSLFLNSMVNLGLFPEDQTEKVEPIVTDLMERLRGMDPNEVEELDLLKLNIEIRDAVRQMDGVVIPQELVLYGRTFTLLAGVCKAIVPGINALAVARPLLSDALFAGGPPEDPLAQSA